MIDFIRIQYKDKSVIEPFVVNKENFEQLYTSLEYHSGEVNYPYRVFINSMEIVVTETSVFVKNSLHKLFNVITRQGQQNYNDFDYTKLCFVIDSLTSSLVGLNEADITQLEFGLNVNTEIPAEYIVHNNVLMHQFQGYSHNRRFGGRGEYKQFDHSNYCIKIYDKAKQYKRLNNILRFEIKFVKKREFNILGIKHIQDLKSTENLRRLFEYLQKRFDELIIVDDYSGRDNISDEEKQKLVEYTNIEFWNKFSERRYRNVKARHKQVFNQMLEQCNLLQTKENLRDLLEQKFQELINQ